jgi:hypothetical protein
MRRFVLFGSAALVLLGVGVGAYCFRVAPQYCWLCFGPEARLRLLVSVRGEGLTFDEFLDHVPTGRKESFRSRAEFTGMTLRDPDGQASYALTRIGGGAAQQGEPAELIVHVEISGPLVYGQYCDVRAVAGDRQRARVAHFHGPLAAGPATVNWQLPAGLVLRRGKEPTDLRAVVGTMDAAKGCWVVVRSENLFMQPEARRSMFPKGVHPVADIEFPPKRPGDPPIKRQFALDQFC